MPTARRPEPIVVAVDAAAVGATSLGAVLSAVARVAGIDADTVQTVEAHGTTLLVELPAGARLAPWPQRAWVQTRTGQPVPVELRPAWSPTVAHPACVMVQLRPTQPTPSPTPPGRVVRSLADALGLLPDDIGIILPVGRTLRCEVPAPLPTPLPATLDIDGTRWALDLLPGPGHCPPAGTPPAAGGTSGGQPLTPPVRNDAGSNGAVSAARAWLALRARAGAGLDAWWVGALGVARGIPSPIRRRAVEGLALEAAVCRARRAVRTPRALDVARALAATGYAPAWDPMAEVVAQRPPRALREEAARWPLARLDRRLASLRKLVTADGPPRAAIATLEAAREDRRLPSPAGPAAALASLLADAGGAHLTVLRSGGRAVGGWGALRWLFGDLERLAPRGDADHPVDAAFAAVASARPDAEARVAAAESWLAERGVAPWWEGLLLRAELAAARGDVGAARSLLLRARALAPPDRPDAHVVLSDLEALAGNDFAALVVLDEAPDHPVVRARKARLLWLLGQRREAMRLGYRPRPRGGAASGATAGAPHPTLAGIDAIERGEVREEAVEAALSLGHADHAARWLTQRFERGEATQREVLWLLELAARRHVALEAPSARRLIEAALLATGAGLPGGAGSEAAHSAGLAAAVARHAGLASLARRCRAIERLALDASLEHEPVEPQIGVLLTRHLADLLARGRRGRWAARRRWALRLLREAGPQHTAAAFDAARELVQALRAANHDDAVEVEHIVDSLLPRTAADVARLSPTAQRAAFALLETLAGRAAARTDPRFTHAPIRRLAAARAALHEGRRDAAANALLSLLRHSLPGGGRAEAFSLLVALADLEGHEGDRVRDAIVRGVVDADTAALDAVAEAAPSVASGKLRDQLFEILARQGEIAPLARLVEADLPIQVRAADFLGVLIAGGQHDEAARKVAARVAARWATRRAGRYLAARALAARRRRAGTTVDAIEVLEQLAPSLSPANLARELLAP